MNLTQYVRFKKKYILQVCIAFFFMFAALLALGTLTETLLLSAIGACSLGSSVTTAFITPTSPTSHPVNAIGGYIIGMCVGFLCFYGDYFTRDLFPLVNFINIDGAFGALAISLSLVIMAILKLEHPPAAGFALGLVLEHWDHYTIIIVITFVLMLTVIKRLLLPWLDK
ncbi:MAG: HPP family protein [Pseudomonadota bacterium]